MFHIERATIYQAVPWQTNADNFTTASGFKLNTNYNHRQYNLLAVSRDLLKVIPYGSEVIIEGTNSNYDGVWYVYDTMNRRYTMTIDFLTNPGTPNELFTDVRLIYERNIDL